MSEHTNFIEGIHGENGVYKTIVFELIYSYLKVIGHEVDLYFDKRARHKNYYETYEFKHDFAIIKEAYSSFEFQPLFLRWSKHGRFQMKINVGEVVFYDERKALNHDLFLDDFIDFLLEYEDYLDDEEYERWKKFCYTFYTTFFTPLEDEEAFEIYQVLIKKSEEVEEKIEAVAAKMDNTDDEEKYGLLVKELNELEIELDLVFGRVDQVIASMTKDEYAYEEYVAYFFEF